VPAKLIDGPEDIDLAELQDIGLVGLTAGASAPEHLVQAVVARLRDEGWREEELVTLQENVKFSLPRELA
jgi:4-hydroxy-3-methylbut-2-enyl diphosphate reductase